MKRPIVALALLAVLASCTLDSKSPRDGSSSTPPPMSVKVSVQGEKLLVDGKVRVADGSRVVLLVGRNVKFAKDNIPRSTTIAKGDATVDAGRFRATLPVDESELVFDAGGKRYGKIEILSDSVTACAQVTQKGSDKPLESIATTNFPSVALPDLKAALGKVPQREHRVGQAFCAI